MDYDLYFERALNAVAKYDPERRTTILNLVLEQIADDTSVSYGSYKDFDRHENLLYNV